MVSGHKDREYQWDEDSKNVYGRAITKRGWVILTMRHKEYLEDSEIRRE